MTTDGTDTLLSRLHVLSLHIALVSAALPALVTFALVTALGVPLCFLLGAAIQKLPYAQRVL